MRPVHWRKARKRVRFTLLGALVLLFFGSAGHNCWPKSGNILTKAQVPPLSFPSLITPVCYECKLKVYKSNKFHLSCFNFTRLPPLHLHSEMVANCWAFRQRIFNAKCAISFLRRFIKFSAKRHLALRIWIRSMHSPSANWELIRGAFNSLVYFRNSKSRGYTVYHIHKEYLATSRVQRANRNSPQINIHPSEDNLIIFH